MYVVGGGNGVYLTTNEEATVQTGNPTTTIVACSPATVLVNNLTRCTATVTDTNSTGPITPSGNVTFASSSTGTFTGACALTGTGATASCATNVTYTPTGAGQDTGQSNYQGDNVHSTSGGTSGAIPSTLKTSPVAISCPATTPINTPAACTVPVTDTSPAPALTPTGTIMLTTNSTGP